MDVAPRWTVAVGAATRGQEVRLMEDEDDWSVASLVRAAAAGHQAAWNELVDRFTPLMVSVVNRYRLSTQDAQDVEQNVWERLLHNLDNLREPAALPGWIRTTVTREALKLATGRRTLPLYDDWPMADDEEPDAALIADERHASLLAAVAQLPARQRDLLLLLISDPRPSYDEISARLGIPKGSIGPTRARALQRLRRLLETISLAQACER
jgi:RNA polymerase sigma factor (sigma-70 family)